MFIAQTFAKRNSSDPSAADWRRFGRLPVFTNCMPRYRKDNGLYPYPASNETELSLLFMLSGGELWAIEIKLTSASKIERSFRFACADLNPLKRFYVYPGTERIPLDDRKDAIGVALTKALQSANLGRFSIWFREI